MTTRETNLSRSSRTFLVWMGLFGFGLSACALDKLFPTDLRGKTYPKDGNLGDSGDTGIEELASGGNDPNADSDRNGARDDGADADGDGLTNKWEKVYGFDPDNADSGSRRYGMDRAGNGITDCNEDIDNDGAGICYELQHGLDTESQKDATADADGDVFANAEEAPGYDPNDATSHPGEGPLLVVRDDDLDIQGKTNTLTVRGTFGYCNLGDQLLFTRNGSQPEASDSGFVACTTDANALTTTLTDQGDGPYTVYVWRKNGVGVVESPASASVTLDRTGPSDASVSVTEDGETTLKVTATVPTGAALSSNEVLRFSGTTSCSALAASSGTALALVDGAVRDTGLVVGTSYCYRISVEDDLGNESLVVGSYAPTPPAVGTLVLGGQASRALDLSLGTSSSGDFARVDLVRYLASSCTGAEPAAGTVISAAAGTTVRDSGLPLGQALCYLSFWYDTYGNRAASDAVVFAADGPDAGGLRACPKITCVS